MRDAIYDNALNAVNELRAKYGIGDGWPLTELPVGRPEQPSKCPISHALRCFQSTYDTLYWIEEKPSLGTRLLVWLGLHKMLPWRPVPACQSLRAFMIKFDNHGYPELEEGNNA